MPIKPINALFNKIILPKGSLIRLPNLVLGGRFLIGFNLNFRLVRFFSSAKINRN